MTRPTPRRDERGSVLVEAALVLPILVVLLFGITEYGMAWRTGNHAAKTVRNSVVELQRAPTERLADHRVLEQVRQAAGTSGLDRTLWVIVYRTPASVGPPPASCTSLADGLASGSAGVMGLCNVYSPSFVAGATAGQFTKPDCAGEPDRWLCPTTRRSTFAATDRIGIAVRWRHEWVTGILPGEGITSTDHAVGTLAPERRPS